MESTKPDGFHAMPPEVNIRSTHCLLARTLAGCAHCHRSTPMFAIVVPPQHLTRDLDGAPDEDVTPPTWSSAAGHAFLFYIEFLPPAQAARLALLAPTYRCVSGQGPDSRWINHCERCGAPSDDEALFCEPGGAFLPVNAAAAGRIDLLILDGAFEACAGGYAPEPAFFAAIRGA